MNPTSAAKPLENLRPSRKNRDRDASGDWDRHLPESRIDAVEIPLHFEHYSEYEINARRSVGYDADDQPCFTTHRFLLTRPVSDDDEEFYEIVAYSEEMAAWRLRDERWLVFRTSCTDNGRLPRSFYSFSQDMPR